MSARIVILLTEREQLIEALQRAIRQRVLAAEITLVVTPNAALAARLQAQYPGLTIRHYVRNGESEAITQSDEALAQLLRPFRPDWVVVIRWPHSLSSAFLRHYAYRVINLHPALPGKFPGSDPIAQAHAAYQRGEIKQTGVTMHLVTDERSQGPRILTTDVAIYAQDTLETLTRRIQQSEEQAIVAGLHRLIEGDE